MSEVIRGDAAGGLIRLTAELNIQNMRAYVAQAITPVQVQQAVDSAFDGALAEFPLKVRAELERGLNEVVREIVRDAISDWSFRREMAERLRPIALQAIADSAAEAAKRAREKNEGAA